MPLDLLDRVMIVRTLPYSQEEMTQVRIFSSADNLCETLFGDNYCIKPTFKFTAILLWPRPVIVFPETSIIAFK